MLQCLKHVRYLEIPVKGCFTVLIAHCTCENRFATGWFFPIDYLAYFQRRYNAQTVVVMKRQLARRCII